MSLPGEITPEPQWKDIREHTEAAEARVEAFDARGDDRYDGGDEAQAFYEGHMGYVQDVFQALRDGQRPELADELRKHDPERQTADRERLEQEARDQIAWVVKDVL